MRIAYVAILHNRHEDGVGKKVRGQIRRWRTAGHDVRLFALVPGGRLWSGMDELPATVLRKGVSLARQAQVARLCRRVGAWSPELVYLRYDRYYPALEWLARRQCAVLEVNTDDLVEFRFDLPAPKYWAHRLLRRRLLERAAGFVFVTAELAQRFSSFPGRGLVLANGIELTGYPELPPADNESPRLVFIGSRNYRWHGTDKLIALARRRPSWAFEVIGYDDADDSDPLPPNLRSHGRLDQAAYQAVMAQCDVAVGSLALNRNDLSEACPLKVREYLALGLPTIIGYRDTDFPEPPWFVLQLGGDEDNVMVGLERIERFVDEVRGRRVPRHAVSHLDAAVKEQCRLGFLESVLTDSRAKTV